MIKKLLLIRKKMMESDRLDKAGLLPLVVGEPLNVKPEAWSDEADISHYGFVLEMKLKDWQATKKWADSNSDVTLVDMIVNKKEVSIEQALHSVGLHIHPAI